MDESAKRTPTTGGESSITHRVSPKDIGVSVAMDYYGRVLPDEVPSRLGAALQLMLEQRGVLKLGELLASRAGQALTLPSEIDFLEAFRDLDRSGALPDGRAGERSAARRRDAQRFSQVADARTARITSGKGGVRLRGRRQSRPQCSPASDGDIELAPIPARRRGAAAGRRGAGKARRKRRRAAAGVELTPIPRGSSPRQILAAALSPSDFRAVTAFCHEHFISLYDVAELATAGHYQGEELGLALKAYVTAYHATSSWLVDLPTYVDLDLHFMVAIENGRVHFAIDPQANAHAQYNWDTNTIVLNEAGIDLDSLLARGMLLHEAQHVIQDSRQQSGTRYDFERQAHGVFAEYILRSTGVFVYDNGTVRVNLMRANQVISAPHEHGVIEGRVWDAPDALLMREKVNDTVIEILESGELRRFAPPVEAGEAEMFVLGNQGDSEFEQVYFNAQRSDPRNSHLDDASLDSMLRTVYRKDGLPS